MIVTASASVQGRTVSVELSETDMVIDPSWSTMAKHQRMMQEADRLIVRYLYEDELITGDYAGQRLREIEARSVRVPT